MSSMHYVLANGEPAPGPLRSGRRTSERTPLSYSPLDSGVCNMSNRLGYGKALDFVFCAAPLPETSGGVSGGFWRSFLSTTTSTLRFMARPWGVAFEATGRNCA